MFDITVVMATCNGELYIEEQLQSILNQSYKNFELIVCDDASTDNTVQIIRKYMQEFPFIKLEVNNSRLGVVKNFEMGIRKAKSCFIALSDQDDIWHMDKLYRLHQEILKMQKQYPNSPILVHSDLRMIDETGKIRHQSYFKYRNYRFNNTRSIGRIVGPCGVMGNTIMMNKELIEIALPFPEDTKIHDYWLALVNEIFGRRVTLDEAFVDYRIHPRNVSNPNSIYQKRSFFLIVKSWYKRDIKLPFMDIKRDKLIMTLLNRYTLTDDDIEVIEVFLDYLRFSKNKLVIWSALVKFNLIKSGWKYRIVLLIKMLWTKKYRVCK